MCLFMFILIPAILVYECLRAENKLVLLLSLCGMVTGILVSACTAVFTYLHRVPDYGFGSNFVYYLLSFYALPVILLYAAYFFCTKDSREIRIKAFFPLTASFYMIFMPYVIIASDNSLCSFFMLFVKPVLLVSMLFICSRLCHNINDGVLNQQVPKIVVNSVLLILAFSVPAALETMWVLNFLEIVVFAVSFVIALFALVLFFIESRHGTKYFF